MKTIGTEITKSSPIYGNLRENNYRYKAKDNKSNRIIYYPHNGMDMSILMKVRSIIWSQPYSCLQWFTILDIIRIDPIPRFHMTLKTTRKSIMKCLKYQLIAS